MMLEPGAFLPDFSVHDHTGQPVTKADLLGSWTVLWWFAAAATAG